MSQLKTNIQTINTGIQELVNITDAILNKKILPYTELQYIKSTGTQYINTGFYPRTTNVNITTESKFNKANSNFSADHCVLGARTGTGPTQGYKLPNFYGSILEYQGLCQAGEFSGSYSANTDYIVKCEVKPGSQNWYVNGVLNKSLTNSTSSSNPGGNLFMLALNASGSPTWYFRGKLYYCKIWQDDVLVRDFIPVKRRLDDIICVYDKVNEQFYTNAGSGVFTPGPEIQ